jgi:hypothetical protein
VHMLQNNSPLNGNGRVGAYMRSKLCTVKLKSVLRGNLFFEKKKEKKLYTLFNKNQAA